MLGCHGETRVSARESSSLQASGTMSCSRNCALSICGVPSMALVSQHCSELIRFSAPLRGAGEPAMGRPWLGVQDETDSDWIKQTLLSTWSSAGGLEP